MHCGLRNAVHSLASVFEVLHLLVALRVDWIWVAAEEVFVLHPQMMRNKKVCQTGRHLLHSDVEERKKMPVKLWKCTER